MAVDPIPVREWPPEMRDAMAAMIPRQAAVHARRGEKASQGAEHAGTFAHHPVLAQAFFTFNGHLLLATTLTERHRELVILRTAAAPEGGLRVGAARAPRVATSASPTRRSRGVPSVPTHRSGTKSKRPAARRRRARRRRRHQRRYVGGPRRQPRREQLLDLIFTVGRLRDAGVDDALVRPRHRRRHPGPRHLRTEGALAASGPSS